jgi:single-stranded-DNA-specific exonuclease
MTFEFATAVSTETEKELKAYSPLLKTLLANRGITDEQDAKDFLEISYESHLHDPFLLPDMKKSVDRIIKAIDANEKIIIYSDYDADGIPGGAMLADFFRKIGYENVSNYIPHRHDEGYGFHLEALEKFAEEKAHLIITIDCGITAKDEATRAKELGVDLIITDHHECPPELPDAFAVINPKRKDSKYPFPELCGTGVAFKLVQAILQKRDFGLKPGSEKLLLDLVGLATLSDMVPLTGENRALARFGLTVLRMSRRPGLVYLLKTLNMSQRHLTEDDVAFMITPRINAASRMDHPDDAFELLYTNDEVRAGALAKHLHKINDERKGLVASIVKDIRGRLEKEGEQKSILVAGNPKWRPSLLGLVANTLMEDVGRPVFLWGRDGGGEIKGSCRANNGMSVVDLMRESKDALLEYGGHKNAGGFSASHESIHLLDERLNEAFKTLSKQQVDMCPVSVDTTLSLDEVTLRTYTDLEKVSPFGIGNVKPLFMFQNCVVASVRQFGKQKNHLEVSFERPSGGRVSAISFFTLPDKFGERLREGSSVNFLGHVEKSVFGGRQEIRIRLVDVI